MNPNPFRDPKRKPAWAEFTRLAGDRAALLFGELRKCLGHLQGLEEQITYAGAEEGWRPSYRLINGSALFEVAIFPGRLEARIELKREERAALYGSGRISTSVRATIAAAGPAETANLIVVPLGSGKAVRAFASLVTIVARRRSGSPLPFSEEWSSK